MPDPKRDLPYYSWTRQRRDGVLELVYCCKSCNLEMVPQTWMEDRSGIRYEMKGRRCPGCGASQQEGYRLVGEAKEPLPAVAMPPDLQIWVARMRKISIRGRILHLDQDGSLVEFTAQAPTLRMGDMLKIEEGVYQVRKVEGFMMPSQVQGYRYLMVPPRRGCRLL